MLFKTSPEKFWNLIASKYAASPIADRSAYETKIQDIKTYLTPAMVVLDIGCGTGTQCADIADRVKQVTGIDISSKLLAIAEQRMAERKMDNVAFLQSTTFDERFAPGSFDVVMAFHVLHFFDDIDAGMQRIHDLLKPGGLFISETACLGEKSQLTARMLRFMGYLGLLPTINMLTTRQLEQALEKAGFQMLEKTKFSDNPEAEFTLIAKKI
mgnify:FL=1